MIHRRFEFFSDEFYIHYAADKTPQDVDFPLHAHNSFEILGCISGKGKFVVEGGEYNIEPGCIIATRPMETHKLYVDPCEPYERIMVNFTLDSVRRLDPNGILLKPFFDRELGQYNLYSPIDFSGANGISYLKKMVIPTDSRDEQRLNCAINLFPLLSELNRIFIAKKASETQRIKRNTPQLIIDYINNNLQSEELTLDTISEHFFLSRSQIGRIFKTATGSSVMDYIIIKRLMKALEYLERGEPAVRACHLSGFNDYSNFYRAFKKRFGKSPTKIDSGIT